VALGPGTRAAAPLQSTRDGLDALIFHLETTHTQRLYVPPYVYVAIGSTHSSFFHSPSVSKFETSLYASRQSHLLTAATPSIQQHRSTIAVMARRWQVSSSQLKQTVGQSGVCSQCLPRTPAMCPRPETRAKAGESAPRSPLSARTSRAPEWYLAIRVVPDMARSCLNDFQSSRLCVIHKIHEGQAGGVFPPSLTPDCPQFQLTLCSHSSRFATNVAVWRACAATGASAPQDLQVGFKAIFHPFSHHRTPSQNSVSPSSGCSRLNFPSPLLLWHFRVLVESNQTLEWIMNLTPSGPPS